MRAKEHKSEQRSVRKQNAHTAHMVIRSSSSPGMGIARLQAPPAPLFPPSADTTSRDPDTAPATPEVSSESLRDRGVSSPTVGIDRLCDECGGVSLLDVSAASLLGVLRDCDAERGGAMACTSTFLPPSCVASPRRCSSLAAAESAGVNAESAGVNAGTELVCRSAARAEDEMVPKARVSSTSRKLRATRGEASCAERMKNEIAIASVHDDSEICTSSFCPRHPVHTHDNAIIIRQSALWASVKILQDTRRHAPTHVNIQTCTSRPPANT